MLITCFVKPNARKTAILKRLDEWSFSIAIHAAPIDGAANEELIRFLAKELRVPQNSLILKRGHRSKQKVVEAPGSADLSRLLS
jgi:uncharacterized protein (TIGR00251 family)